MRLQAFDTSDVDETADRLDRLERQLRAGRIVAARAFAQGFTAALEDSNPAEWAPYYAERAGG